MNKEIRKIIFDKLDDELNKKGFCLADSTNKYAVYHKVNNNSIEIIQWAQDKYESYTTVSASIVFLNTSDEKSNINYKWFNDFNNGDYSKINVDDCRNKYFLKGHFGREFHYGDVYVAVGRGIVGVTHDSKDKPLGFKIKRYKDSTYTDLSNLIIKRMNRIYLWLEKTKSTNS